MDTLNDYYPLYPENPETKDLSESEFYENNEYINTLNVLNGSRKRKKVMNPDEWNAIHSDDLWYLWCIINEYTTTNNSGLLNLLSFGTFCDICYQNSTK